MPDIYKDNNYKRDSDVSGEYVLKNQLSNTNSFFNEETRSNLCFFIHYNVVTHDIKFSNIDENIEYNGYEKIVPHKNSNGTHKFHA